MQENFGTVSTVYSSAAKLAVVAETVETVPFNPGRAYPPG
jgi:hypothetical protein